MTKSDFMTNITRTFNRASLQVRKHSPEILMVAGVVGTVISAVMACKATTKLSGIMDNTKGQVDAIHYAKEHPEELKEEYTPEDAKKDLTIVYTKTGIELVKLYGPSIALGALSIAGILTSNSIHRRRNVALAAAYTAVDTGFKQYRGRLIERFGEQLDKELRYNIQNVEVEEKIVDDKGKEKTVKKTVEVVDTTGFSDYARLYDDGNAGWDKDPEYTLMFLKHQQNYANDKLRTQGHLFLNEVYDMLGIPRSKAGQIVGWIYDEKNNNHDGDNFVDFGIYTQANKNFLDGYEKVALLDFNVDGPIYNKI